MPFTLSHAAAVLPIARYLNRWRALSAAVIGSMVPDFAYFSPWKLARIETHSLPGIFTFSLPVGLLTYWVFEFVVKPATYEILPDTAHARAYRFAAPDRLTSWRQWLTATLAIVFGALTHLTWDAFTHEGARGVRMIPILDDPMEFHGHPLLVWQILQLGSSALGLAVVVVVLGRAMRADSGPLAFRPRRLNSRQRRTWMSLYIAVAIATCVYSGRVMSGGHFHRVGASTFVEFLAIGGLRGLVCSLFLVSLVLRITQVSDPYRSS